MRGAFRVSDISMSDLELFIWVWSQKAKNSRYKVPRLLLWLPPGGTPRASSITGPTLCKGTSSCLEAMKTASSIHSAGSLQTRLSPTSTPLLWVIILPHEILRTFGRGKEHVWPSRIYALWRTLEPPYSPYKFTLTFSAMLFRRLGLFWLFLRQVIICFR